jgi:hypothetical protein
MQVVYQGLSKAQRAEMVAAYRKSLVLPDPHGKMLYKIDRRRDTEQTIERKRKLAAEKIKEMVGAYEAKLAKNDESREIGGIVFKKGEPVIVDEKNPLNSRNIDGKTKKPYGPTKLEALVEAGTFKIVDAKPSVDDSKKKAV